MPPSEKEMASRRKRRKHNVHEEFFDEFNEYSTYVLGYLYARGSIRRQNDVHELRIAASNLEQLIKIRHLLSSEYPIQETGSTFNMTIASKRLIEVLDTLGLKQGKFDNLVYPSFIPPNLERHFIRGYFDGRGTYIPDSQRRVIINFSCGSPVFLEGLRDALVTLGLSRVNLRKSGRAGASNIIRYYVKDTRKLYYIMYNRSRIYAKEKKERYDESLRILNTIERKKYMTGRS